VVDLVKGMLDKSRISSTSDPPLVSVVITTYNYAQYLSNAIESVLKQTHSNLEILIVDDGSTDDTRMIVEKYAGSLSYFFKENGGISSARNFGVTRARGSYIVFLDSDDKFHQNYITEALEILREQTPSVGFSYTQLQCFEASSQITEFGEYDVERLKDSNCIPSVCLVRADVARKYQYDETISILEDWNFYLTLAENGVSGVLLNKPLVYYRKHFDGDSALDKVDPKSWRRAFHKVVLRHKRLYGPGTNMRHQLWWVVNVWLGIQFPRHKT
jgi:glycosyltransferase involved in cell wall biosynthesis